MSKEQVSGSLTLSLGGLADEVAGEVVVRLASTLRELAQQRPVFYQPAAMVGVLTGFGVPYDLAESVARNMAVHGLGIAQVEPDDRMPDTSQPESAVDWFKREVDL